jgi:hypothetical protein
VPVDRAKSAMTMACRIVTLLSALTITACGKWEVIVYASFDRSLAEPVLQSFEARSSIRVRAIYDTEANKTTGLVNRVINGFGLALAVLLLSSWGLPMLAVLGGTRWPT